LWWRLDLNQRPRAYEQSKFIAEVVIDSIIGLGNPVTFLPIIDDPYFVPLTIIMGMNGLILTIGYASNRQESDKRQIHRDARGF
jgi:hypothetical protein